MPTLSELEPDKQVEKLAERLRARYDGLKEARDYYEGAHTLTFATEKFREAFGGLFREFADNWCSPVVQAPAERMRVEGIHISGERKTDDDAWDIWQRNELDAESDKHHTEILTTGYGYALVWGDSELNPEIFIEDPLNVIVAYDSERRRRREAALKLFRDEWGEYVYATLYRSDFIYKFRSADKGVGGLDIPIGPSGGWVPREVPGEPWPLPNRLGVVPVVEFVNDPDIYGRGRSEIGRVIPIQNAVNKLLADMMVASEFVAFPQRAIVGWAPEIDPKTGKPSTEQVKIALSRVQTFSGKDVKLDEWSQASFGDHIKAIETLVHHMAAQTRTPRHYLIQVGQSPSGDAIKSAETGLVAKVRERQRSYGERWEEVLGLALRFKGDTRPTHRSELEWADPEYRTEGQLTDAIIKQFQAGLIPWRTALRRLGYSPEEIKGMESERMSDAITTGGIDLEALAEEPAPEPVEA